MGHVPFGLPLSRHIAHGPGSICTISDAFTPFQTFAFFKAIRRVEDFLPWKAPIHPNSCTTPMGRDTHFENPSPILIQKKLADVNQPGFAILDTQCAARERSSKNSRAQMQPITQVIRCSESVWTSKDHLKGLSDTVAKVLIEKYISYFGEPEYLHQGRLFEARVDHELCYLFHIKKTQSTPYYPQWILLKDSMAHTKEGQGNAAELHLTYE
ncbi:hypothetical protein T4D_8309 [Trichinella pseudospiralis]|uniref:Uncharacterized protein n=1 Tax=Trichinella pseudospiralis TaxID=6337 RepID=A0A0V1G5G0_TRIPS|nr:hypothetical protein T4D_8309 [Trichinella pseudospiralis]